MSSLVETPNFAFISAISDLCESDRISMASPTPSQSETVTSTSNSSDSELEPPPLNVKCTLCNDTFTIPKVLSCFHTFCQPCLEKIQDTAEKLSCPECHQDTPLPPQGISGLMPDFAISNILESTIVDTSALNCTGCKSKETNAVARCFDCANFLCPNCVMAHQFMHCFEGHRVMMLSDMHNGKDEMKLEKPMNCAKHRAEYLIYFCRTCNMPICKECTVMEHGKGHEYSFINEVSQKQIEMLQQLMDESKAKANELRTSAKNLEHSANRLQIVYTKAQNEINETYNFYRTMLDERRQESIKELEGAYNAKQVLVNGMVQKMQDGIEKLYQGCEFIDKLVKHANSTEILMFKKMIDAKIQSILNYVPESNLQNAFDLEFVSNFQAIQVGVRNTFGYVRQSPDNVQTKPQPIARPNGLTQKTTMSIRPSLPQTNGTPFNVDFSPVLNKQYNTNSLVNFGSTLDANINPYEKWSSGTLDVLGQHHHHSDIFPHNDSVIDLTNKLLTASIYPPKSQIKRQKMIYHCKFGEFGVMDGQFTEPSGVAVNAQNDIIVADTNNHRIQIFDKEGRFKFQFGECGKRDGQLLYPNRVAVVKTSGDIIVTERSPTHQIQIYNQYGQFVRKFGASVLQHPRGVTVDNKGHIIIVECKVMRVIIFDQMGNVLQKFGCSKHLEFPNGVVVNDKEEIFISDNRAHCVKVFSYQGVFLRQIGGEGITNYPIGVGINNAGEILIADNHNNFNLTIFTQDGQLVNALESKVKHAQCFDVSLMDDGSIVLASKDYRLYIYRYLQIPSLGL
ncbi:protein brain tumor-like isoform X2 [Tubulanus polymorphus]|uniref:protein brain tumor-like isoform X2 n=1 Tax=Tubulanus polymorphus TaxID=672921 RepID=UPI003DA34F73